MFQIILVFLLTGSLAACQDAGSEFRFKVAVPKEVSALAESRLAANSQTPPPVLVLQGLESPLNEGANIQVLGEPQPGAKERPVLGVAGLVGSPSASAGTSSEKINILVPLNDEAARLLAGKSEINLVLRVEGDRSQGKNFKVDRVFFQQPKSH